ncbi:MAG: iron-containing alcohol dehydrogenase [Clostridiales bacterium]|nr:iron-containing alcohol dehydrogenase [Clostridiales bacterium]
MNNFNFYSPTEFVFGRKTENSIADYIKKYNGTKVLVHYGSKSAVKSGLLDRVKKSLDNAEIDYMLLGGVLPNPRDTKVYEGINICRENGIDFILCVGGGSVIDSGKAISIGVEYDGDFWDFYSTDKKIEKALPIGVVLTIAAAGSEGSDSTVITKEDGMLKRSTGSDIIRPKFAILNPELTMTLPAYQTACGATDIMAHVLERYITNTKEVEITDRLCEAVLLTMIKETPRAIKEPDNYHARANIMWAGTVAHNDIVGVGREGDWNSHTIEHELSGLYDCAHGAGLAVIMPSWMEFVYKHDIMRFAQLAVRVWGCEMNFQNPELTAYEGIQRFRHFLSSIGMPINFEQIGAKKEDIPLLIEKQGISDGWGFVPLDKDAVYQIYMNAVNAKI